MTNGTDASIKTVHVDQSGDANIGNLYRLMLLHPNMTVYEQVVYMQILK